MSKKTTISEQIKECTCYYDAQPSINTGCPYTSRDIGHVIEGLFPDVTQMIVNHTIPETSADSVYNQIEELKDVGFRVNDDFDMLMLARRLKDSDADISSNVGMGSSQGDLPVNVPVE